MSKILMCGGGTMGPVTPLIAVANAWKRIDPTIEFHWAITPSGPEGTVLREAGFASTAIPVAKFSRHLSIDLLLWPWRYWSALRAAKRLLLNIRPDLIVSAGGFTAAPVIRTASGMGIPSVIHQLDREPGLTNLLSAGLATDITSSFAVGDAFHRTVDVVPTPNRFAGKTLVTSDVAKHAFGFSGERPVLLVVGGGTGSRALNQWVAERVEELVAIGDVIHIFGQTERDVPIADRTGLYRKAFLSEADMFLAFCAADLVVTRAGMGALSDASTMRKPAIVVPISDSHQQANAKMLPYPVVMEGERFAERLFETITKILSNPREGARLAEEAQRGLQTDDGTTLAQRWNALIRKSTPSDGVLR